MTSQLAPIKFLDPAMEPFHLFGLDYYKLTMSKWYYCTVPSSLDITFKLQNRSQVSLLKHIDIDELQRVLNLYCDKGALSSYEASRVRGNLALSESRYSPYFLHDLQSSILPDITVSNDGSDLSVESIGSSWLVTLWETIVMSTISEMHYKNWMEANGVSYSDLHDEGTTRLVNKVKTLNEFPDLHFIDFGTRRRFSLHWQRQVHRYLLDNASGYQGTSNSGIALLDYHTSPVGTYAHEMDMVATARALATDGESAALEAHSDFMRSWGRLFPNLTIALSDTFGSKFFFETFKPFAEEWKGVRQDSGDPFIFADKTLAFYSDLGIDPKTKTIIFSDSLTVDLMIKLYERYNGAINVSFGWGTNLTNDLGPSPLNIVMKPVRVSDPYSHLYVETVKLSDDMGKHSGPPDLVMKYKKMFQGA